MIRTPFSIRWFLAGLLVHVGTCVLQAQSVDLLGQKAGVGSAATAEPAAAKSPGAWGLQPPGAAANAPAPFLSKAIEPRAAELARAGSSARFVLPTREKIETAWHDMPFAVNVPFEVPFEGGAVRVLFEFFLDWEEPERAYRPPVDPRTPYTDLLNQFGSWEVFLGGIYRLDSATPAPGSVRLESETGRDGGRVLPQFDDAGFPVWADDRGVLTPASSPAQGPLWGSLLRRDPPKPRPAAWHGRLGDVARNPSSEVLTLSPAKPGWHSAWVTLAPVVRGLWPAVRPDQTLHARLYARTIVTRLPPTPAGALASNELTFLWGDRTKFAAVPERLRDPTIVRVQDVSVPIVIRQNDWLFEKAEIAPIDKPWAAFLATGTTQLADRSNNSPWTLQTSVAPLSRGFQLGLQLTSHLRPARNAPTATPVHSADHQWKLDFPASVTVPGYADLLIEGSYAARWLPNSGVAPGSFTPKSGGFYWIRSEWGQDKELGHVFTPGSPVAFTRQPEATDPPRQELNEVWLTQAPKPGEPGYHLRLHVVAPDASRWIPAESRAKQFTNYGPRQVFSLRAGPWQVNANYRRRSEVERLGSEAVQRTGPTPVVNERDPFWEWYPKHSRLLRDQLALVSGGGRTAAVLGQRRAQLARTKQRIMGAVVGTQSSWFDVFGSSTPLALSDLQKRHALARVQQIDAELRVLKQRIDEVTQTTQAAFDRIDADIGAIFYRPDLKEHFELSVWQSHWRQQAAQARLRLALAFGDVGTFAEQVAALEGAALDADTRLAESAMLANTGDMVGAWWSARRAAQVAPNRADVAERLRDLEVAFLRAAMEKSQGTIREARKQFDSYLGERGFAAREPGRPSFERDGWVAALKLPFSESSREYLLATITTGVVGSLSAILGDKPQSEERALAAVESRMSVAYLGLQLMLRLRLQGMTFGEIAKLDTKALAAALPVSDVHGQPYDERHFRQLGLAIHAAIQFPEIKALVTACSFRPAGDLKPGDYATDRREMDRGVAAGYWDLTEVGNTWAEWFGDITSAKNLVLLCLPRAVGRVGGGSLEGAAFWSAEQSAAVAAAAQAGRVELGVPVVARMIGWDRAVQSLGATGPGQWVLEGLERSIEYQQGLGAFDRRLWTASQALGGYLISQSLQQVAKEKGGPWAELFVEGVGLFGGDSAKMKKLLAAGRRESVREAARVIRETYLPVAERQAMRITTWREEVKLLTDALAAQKAGKNLSDAHLKYLARYEVGGAPRRIPNGLPSHDADIARHGAAESIARNTHNGAAEAAVTLGPDVDAELEALKKSNAAVNAAVHAADEAAEMISAAFARPLAADRVHKTYVFAKFAQPPRVVTGSKLAQAERALADGEGEKAAGLFRELIAEGREAAEVRRPLTRNEYPLEVLELKLQAAERIGLIPKLAPTGVGAHVAAIEDAELAEALLLSRKSLMEAVGEKAGATGAVSVAGSGSRRYAIKSFRFGEGTKFIDADHVKRTVAEGEVVVAELARALGIEAAGARLVVNDATKEVLVVSRWIDGVRLDNLSAEELQALAPQLAVQKLFAMAVGNYDLKLDNMKCAAGRVASFDLGAAAMRGVDQHPMLNFGLDEHDIFQGFWGRDHWIGRAYYYLSDPEQAAKFTAEQRAQFAKLMFVETALDARHVQPAIERLKKFTGGDGAEARAAFERGFRKVYADEAKVQECVGQAMTELKRKMLQIEPAVMEWNLRNGLPPPPSNLDITVPGIPRTGVKTAPAEEWLWRKAA